MCGGQQFSGGNGDFPYLSVIVVVGSGVGLWASASRMRPGRVQTRHVQHFQELYNAMLTVHDR
jgi:hypothetical protein